jgi:phosphatidylserine/phosphatidylglycerophosphate/cardiolipin synthase-like enzyme
MKGMIYFLCTCSSLFSFGKEPISNYQTFFSPQDRLAEALISFIDKEHTSIRIAAYCLTHRQIIQALNRASERGADVQVIVDPYSLRSNSPLRHKKTPRFALHVWAPPQQVRERKNTTKVGTKKSLMHDKFCVLGDDRVWTGSFNFTLEAATSHRENALIVESKEVASSYLAEFERMKNKSCITLRTYLSRM